MTLIAAMIDADGGVVVGRDSGVFYGASIVRRGEKLTRTATGVVAGISGTFAYQRPMERWASGETGRAPVRDVEALRAAAWRLADALQEEDATRGHGAMDDRVKLRGLDVLLVAPGCPIVRLTCDGSLQVYGDYAAIGAGEQMASAVLELAKRLGTKAPIAVRQALDVACHISPWVCGPVAVEEVA